MYTLRAPQDYCADVNFLLIYKQKTTLSNLEPDPTFREKKTEFYPLKKTGSGFVKLYYHFGQ